MFTTSTRARAEGSPCRRCEVHDTALGVVNATLIGAFIWTVMIGAWLLA